MWLTSSSVGRKFIMALTGICLVLFITFHCLMNSIAIIWPSAYNVICEFLGANWYALIASMGLAVLFIIHIIYAVWLTLMNRRARGGDRYSINKTPKSVEWSSKNMLVLGIVVVAFIGVHLVQFWAKMQLVEVMGCHGTIPAAAGTLFIQEAFKEIWTPIVYIIGFVALWFHMNHGFWSMFQSIGWDSTAWIPRWKKIGSCWTTIVIALFVAQAVVFTYQSQKNYYSENQELRNQYATMAAKSLDKYIPGITLQANYNNVKAIATQVSQNTGVIFMQLGMQTPDFKAEEAAHTFINVANLVNYLEGNNNIDTKQLEDIAAGKQAEIPQMQMMGMPQGQPQAQPEAAPSAEQQAADEAPATEANNENK